MSLLNLKQVAGPKDGALGGVVVFDSGKPNWSTDINSAMVVPTGTTAERPQIAVEGSLRFNSETQKLEGFEGNEWKEFASPRVIKSEDGLTFVDINRNGFPDEVAMGSFGKEVLLVKGSETEATAGEKLTITHVDDEVQLVAQNSAGTGNVDVRVMPQGSGHVFFGLLGDGVVESEIGFDLIVRGGGSDISNGPGNTTITGGNATTGNFDGGDLILKPGTGFGTGTFGNISIVDGYDVPFLTFESAGDESSNYMVVKNGASNVDGLINGVKLAVAGASTSANVDMYLDPKGNGLVRVADYSTYTASLNAVGGSDALVTKGYVLSLAGLGEGDTNNIIAGAGLTDDNGTFNVNVGATTIGLDGVNNLIVKSNATAGQILISTGVAGEQAEWGGLDLSSSASFTGVLGPTNGGLGFTSFAQGDLLVGNAGATLDKIAIGTVGKALLSTGTSVSYSYITKLVDDNGKTSIATRTTADAVNNLFATNAAADGNVELGAEGTNDDISIQLSPKGLGVLLAPVGYTANIGSNAETLVTKSFVETAIAGGGDSLTRKVALTGSWASEMNLGTVLPNPVGKAVYVDRAIIRTITPISGGGATQAKIMSGTDVVMDLYESDLLTAGTYLADLSEAFASTNTQLKIQFFAADGTTAATPTGGSLDVTVLYRIR